MRWNVEMDGLQKGYIHVCMQMLRGLHGTPPVNEYKERKSVIFCHFTDCSVEKYYSSEDDDDDDVSCWLLTI